MSNPFGDQFDSTWPYSIYYTPGQTEGHYSATDPGVWVPATNTTRVLVTGHLTSYGSSERSRLESDWGSMSNGGDRRDGPGPIEQGDRRFFSATALQKGGLLEFYLNSAGTVKTFYRVIAIGMTQNLMRKALGGPVRYEHRIREVPA